MKTLLTLFVLLFSSSVVAEVLLNKIKLNENINIHFSKSEIKKYQSTNKAYGNKKKYSRLYIENPQEIFDDNYTLVTITYESNSKKIQYVSGLHEDLNNCNLLRSEQIIINLENGFKETNKQKNLDDTLQDVISFSYENFSSIYSCEYYAETSNWAGTVDYKYGLITNEYNLWLIKYTQTEIVD